MTSKSNVWFHDGFRPLSPDKKHIMNRAYIHSKKSSNNQSTCVSETNEKNINHISTYRYMVSISHKSGMKKWKNSTLIVAVRSNGSSKFLIISLKAFNLYTSKVY